MTRTLFIVLAVVLALGSCGPGADVNGAGTRAGASTDHELQVTIDGRMLRASGRPVGAQVDYGRTEIRVLVGGSLAWNEGPGAEHMTALLVTNGIAEGSYTFVDSESEVVPGRRRVAWTRLAIDGGVPVAWLEPVRGELVVTDARGALSGGRFRLFEASGTLHGTFVDDSGLEHDVEARFRYTR